MTVITRLGAALVFIAVFSGANAWGSHKDSNSCKPTHFWYDKKSCCLPKGGLHYAPSPPEHRRCPPHDGWYWHPKHECCVPKHPLSRYTPPPCDDKWQWDDDDNCCKPTPCSPGWTWDSQKNKCKPPHPKPSNGAWKKRSVPPHAPRACPSGLDACPVPGSPTDYECIDTVVELESCGGCSSLGEGQDCTTIEGAWNVGCEQGTCAVYTCTAGYRLAEDGRSCLPI